MQRDSRLISTQYKVAEMVSTETKSIIARAKRIYAGKLRQQLEAECSGQFVSIEPESGAYFVADTFSSAVRLARNAYPNRISYTLHIGEPAAFHIGEMRS